MELPHIGQNCIICNRNDYLPFKCAHCSNWVCIDHRSDHGSDCPLTKTSFYAKTDPLPVSESLRRQCDFCRKITVKLELSVCQYCSGNHCLYHRHQIQHSCPKLTEDAETRRCEEFARVERQLEALNRLKATQSACAQKSTYHAPSIQTTDPKKLALARRVRVMRIKQHARGPPNVLDKDKLYFEVEFVHNPNSNLSNKTKHGKKVYIFTTTKHTIGRLIDWSAEELNLTNKNHVHGSDQLVFKRRSEGNHNTVALNNQTTFEDYLESGVLDSGDQLTITYSPSS